MNGVDKSRTPVLGRFLQYRIDADQHRCFAVDTLSASDFRFSIQATTIMLLCSWWPEKMVGYGEMRFGL